MNLAVKAALFLGIGLNLVGCFGDDKETATNKPLVDQMAVIFDNESNEVSPGSVVGYYVEFSENDEINTLMKITNDKITFSILCEERYAEGSAEIDLSESFFGLGLLTFKERLASLRVSSAEEGCEFPGFFEGDSLSYALTSLDQTVMMNMSLVGASENLIFIKISDL